jgi:ferredoxin-NADP reductase
MKAAEYRCTVQSFTMLTPTVFELTFEPQQQFSFEAGQFVSIIIPGAGPKGRDLRRAYSIASSPEKSAVELCVKLVEDGPGTQYLYALRPGDEFRVVAPYGDFVYRAKENRKAFFIATGTGIAPFRSMLLSKHYQHNPPQQSICLLGVRYENELLYWDDFKRIKNLQFIPAISQADASWTGYRGRVTEYLKTSQEPINWLEFDYYLCGHGGMIQEVKSFLMARGVTKDAIHQEVYYK